MAKSKSRKTDLDYRFEALKIHTPSIYNKFTFATKSQLIRNDNSNCLIGFEQEYTVVENTQLTAVHQTPMEVAK